MCGISGLAQKSWDPQLAKAFVAVSDKYLERRGPDDFNVKRITSQLLFTQARLSIIDLADGTQPMSDDDGHIVFNGEIYNYRELKNPQFAYRTKSDTEVLLKGLNHYDTAYLNQVDGMFAFAHYDKHRRRLTLARDLFGIKPLYYYADGERIAFCSRLQPLMLLSKKNICTKALAEYYFMRASRAPRTIFTDIMEVLPGEAVVFDMDTFTLIEKSRWVSPISVKRDQKNISQALSDLEAAMKLAVNRHLVSDVPVASLLSGGVDSGLITAMAAQENPNISAFSIGFHDKAFDESNYSAAICRQYRIRHHVRYCDASEFMKHLMDWPAIMDDAVADPSSVMLYIVAQFARDTGYKVVLTGDGADELFGGYNQYYRFQLAKRLHPYMRHFPLALETVRHVMRDQSRYVHFARTAVVDPHYYGTSMIFEPHLVHELLDSEGLFAEKTNSLTGALDLDLHNRIPNDMLTRTDRATMHASIEARVPFMTRYVGEASWSLSESLLINGRKQKFLLKKLAERYIPYENIYRRKVGFDLPLAQWFRNEMKTMLTDTLSTTWQADYLVPGAMKRVIDDHLTQRNDNADKLWAFLLLDGNVQHLKSINEKQLDLNPSSYSYMHDLTPPDQIYA